MAPWTEVNRLKNGNKQIKEWEFTMPKNVMGLTAVVYTQKSCKSTIKR